MSRVEAAQHLDSLFGEDEGFIGLASGDLEKRHAERQFRWPQEREAAMAWVVQQVGLKRDVYVSPGLLRAMRRKAETALSARCGWSDLDAATPETLAFWRSLPGFVLVESSPGRYHAYVRFDQSVPATEIKALNEQLHTHGGDASYAPHPASLLRLIGTPNVKRGGVVRLAESDGMATPQELRALLGKSESAPVGDTGSRRSKLAELLAGGPDDPRKGNVWLTAVAGHLAKSQPFRDGYDALLNSANANITNPLSAAAVAKIADSIWTREHGNAPAAEPRTLAQVLAVWHEWMAGEDSFAFEVSLGAYAANLLPGDPVWVLVVGGSGHGKTEAIQATSGLPNVRVRSTLSGEAALLSATPKKERESGATGGLLREIGEKGVLVLKDFTSVIAMQRDRRGELLAAFREIYDGFWTRSVGAAGGQTLIWKGKLGLIAGCTTAIDTAYAVTDTLGTRFLTPRVPPVDAITQSKQALRQAGHEPEMRAALSGAVAGLFANGLPFAPTEPDIDLVVGVAHLVAHARSPVDRDYRHEIVLVLDAEAPTRIAKQMLMLYRGLTAIGVSRQRAFACTIRTGFDCVPKLRRAALWALRDGGWHPTLEISKLVDHTKQTTQRALEDMVAHQVINRRQVGKADEWALRARHTVAMREVANASA